MTRITCVFVWTWAWRAVGLLEDSRTYLQPSDVDYLEEEARKLQEKTSGSGSQPVGRDPLGWGHISDFMHVRYL